LLVISFTFLLYINDYDFKGTNFMCVVVSFLQRENTKMLASNPNLAIYVTDSA